MLPRKMALVRFKTEAVKTFMEEFSWQCTIFRPISFLKSHRKVTLRIFLYCYTRDIHNYPQRQRHFRTSPESPFLSSNGLISELTSLILGDIPPTGCTIFRFVFSHKKKKKKKGYNDGDKFSRCKSKMRMNNGLRFFKVACHTSS